MSGSVRMCSGIEFHAAGLACEKAAVVRYQSLTSDVDPDVVGWR